MMKMDLSALLREISDVKVNMVEFLDMSQKRGKKNLFLFLPCTRDNAESSLIQFIGVMSLEEIVKYFSAVMMKLQL